MTTQVKAGPPGVRKKSAQIWPEIRTAFSKTRKEGHRLANLFSTLRRYDSWNHMGHMKVGFHQQKTAGLMASKQQKCHLA